MTDRYSFEMPDGTSVLLVPYSILPPHIRATLSASISFLFTFSTNHIGKKEPTLEDYSSVASYIILSNKLNTEDADIIFYLKRLLTAIFN